MFFFVRINEMLKNPIVLRHIKTQFSANEKPEHKRKKCFFIDQVVVKFVGPLNFKAVQDSGSLPTVVTNLNSWTKVEYMHELYNMYVYIWISYI